MTSVSTAESRAVAAPGVQTPGVDWFMAIALLACAYAAIRAVFFTPVDAMLGAVQKIFYLHVPAAIAGLYIGCGLLAICSIVYLWIKDERLDRLAESAAEVALVFMSVVLTTGPIWGRSSWGTWWVWEPRLTLTLFLWFLVLSYLVLRGAIEQPEARARLSAVMGALAALLVPFIHLTVLLFRSQHPAPIVLTPSALTSSKLPPEMAATFGISLLAFMLLFFAVLRLRYRWATVRDARAALEHG